MMRKRNLKVSGTKQELVERLQMYRENEIASLRRELEETKKKLIKTKREFVEIHQAELNHDGYDKPHLYVRAVTVLFLGVYIIAAGKLLEWRDHVDHISDFGHDLTEPISDWMEENPIIRNTIMIIHGVSMDSLCALIIYLGVFHDDTMRMHVAMIAFYTMRYWCQNLMRLPMPEKWRFYYPGLPSVLVSYDECSDFYFSGHVGAVVLAVIEFERRQWYRMARSLKVFACIMAAVVITTRAHYTVDCIDGVVFAYIAGRFAHNYTRYVDHFFSKIGRAFGLKSTRGDSGNDIDNVFDSVHRTYYVGRGFKVW